MADNQQLTINRPQNLKLSGFTSDNVHVMPEQFYEKTAEKKKGGNFWTILLIVLIVLVVSGILILVFFLFNKNLQTQAQNAVSTKVALAKENDGSKNQESKIETKTPQVVENNSNLEQVKENTTAVILPAKNQEEQLEILPKAAEVANQQSDISITLNKNFTFGADADKDSLSDLEEIIYGTSSTMPDFDSDGFLDGEELENLFNPILPNPALLSGSDLVSLYEGKDFGYSILYPKSWVARSLDSTNREVIFASDSGDFAEVLVEDNPDLYSPLTWYLKQFPQISASSVEKVYSREGLEGVKSLEGTTVYFSNGYHIYAITYNMGTKTVLDFNTTFKMMVKSFKIIINSENNENPANQ